MRLFTALWPPQGAIEHLAAAVRALDPARIDRARAELRGFRFVPSERWHLTLCFHGDDADEAKLGDRMRRRMVRLDRREAEFAAPRLRLAGSGVFRGVLWVGVEPASEVDTANLGLLVRLAGADPRSFRGHLTIGRWARGPTGPARGLLDGYQGPWWSADRIALVSSTQRGAAGPLYSTVLSLPVGGTSGPTGAC